MPFSFHTDKAVGVKYHLTFQRDLEKTMIKEIKAAVLEFITWVKEVGSKGRYPGWRVIPVYTPKIYETKYGVGWHYFKQGGRLRAFKVPRDEGRTEQLKKSLSAAFRTRLEPDIYWDTPYASYVMDRGKALTPGTSAKWPSELAQLYSGRLKAFLKKHLKGMVRYVKIHAEPDN